MKQSGMIALSILLLILLSGCPKPQTETPPPTDSSGESSTEESVFQEEEPEPSSDLPVDWPDDLPLPENTRVIDYQYAGGSLSAVCESDTPIDVVMAFYSQLEGWEHDTDREKTEDSIVFPYKKKDKRLSVTVRKDESVTVISIVYIAF